MENLRKMSPKQTEDSPLKKTEKEHVSNSILKKIQILLLAAIFAAGCTVIVYESPERRARSVYAQHWHYCPYGSFWGYMYWQCMWYHRYPYYSRILIRYPTTGRGVIIKRQLQKPKSTKSVPKGGKVIKKQVVKSEKEKPKKVIKKKDV